MDKFFKAIFLQFSGIVGAGIFALPFVLYNSNFYFSSSLLISTAIVMVLLNFFYISIISDTSGDHQLPGYAQIYLGPLPKILSLLTLGFLCFGGLIAYTKLAATFLNQILPALSVPVLALFFIILVGFFHLRKLNSCKSIFQLLPIINLFIILILFLFSFNSSIPNLNLQTPQISYFGSIIFALSGFTIIPELEETLRYSQKKKLLLHLASLFGVLLAVIVYLIFSYSVIRVSGSGITSDAVVGVFKNNLVLGYFLIFFGLMTVFKAALNLIFVLKEIFFRDFKKSENISYTLSIVISFLVLFFINIPFIKIISFVGAISTLFSALIICLIYSKKAKSGLANFVSIFILSALLLGLILEKLH